MTWDSFRVRQAKNKDVAKIRSFLFQIRHEFQLNMLPQVDRDLQNIEQNYDRRDGFFLILENPTLVGTAGLFKVSDEVCELRKFYVHREARNFGLGQCLLNFIIQSARAKRFGVLRLETRRRFTVANCLYEKFGFRPLKEAFSCASEDDSIFLALSLTERRRSVG